MAMPSDVDQNMAEDATGPVDDMEETRQHASKVKEEIERCLKAGLTKGQIFRRLRNMGFAPAICYAVYKEFRWQNKDFFDLYMLRMSLQRQIRRLNRQLAWCRRLLRRDNAAAGNHQGRICGNPSCSGHQPVAVPGPPHAEAAPRAILSPPLEVASPATAMAQHTHCNHPRRMLRLPAYGGRPGSSRSAVRLSAAGQLPETPCQGVPHACHPVQHAVPNSWRADHAPPASGTFAAGMASSSPLPAQRGGCPCAFHRQVGSQHQQQQQGYQAERWWHAGANNSPFATVQVGAQHQHPQHLPPQQPLRQGGGNVRERQREFRPPTPSHVEEQRLPPSSSSQEALLALQAGEQQEANNTAAAESTATRR